MKNIGPEQLNIFDTLSKTISEGIIIVNSKQKIIASNEAANTMFGFKADELIGAHLETLIPKKYRTKHYTYAENYIGTEDPKKMGHGRDLYGLKKSGEVFPVEAGLNPFTVESDHFVMALVTDISVRKKQEEEILRLNNQLGQLVEERTENLRATIIDLKEEVKRRTLAESKIKKSLEREQELGELKTKFLSLVSHEFKTPLSVILSSATLTGKYKKEDQQGKRDKHLKTIKLQIKTLNNILDDFLSIERLNSNKDSYRMKEFPLSRVFNNVVYDANMVSKEGQKISFPENINKVVHFDEKILELSLTNLLNNAIKYSPKHSTIKIRIESKNEHLILSVTDKGIGIPAKEQKYIFDPYFRAENAVLNKGTGIGLNIVKGHLEKLNSTISFESKEGKGSTFKIIIPHKQTPK